VHEYPRVFERAAHTPHGVAQSVDVDWRDFKVQFLKHFWLCILHHHYKNVVSIVRHTLYIWVRYVPIWLRHVPM